MGRFEDLQRRAEAQKVVELAKQASARAEQAKALQEAQRRFAAMAPVARHIAGQLIAQGVRPTFTASSPTGWLLVEWQGVGTREIAGSRG